MHYYETALDNLTIKEYSKRMKQPKEPKKWKYPRLYMTVYFDGELGRDLRIVYPSGRGAWVNEILDEDFACWASVSDLDLGEDLYSTDDIRPILAEKSRTEMIKYLKSHKGLTPIFIGEIK